MTAHPHDNQAGRPPVTLHLTALETEPLPGTLKGLPAAAEGVPLRALGGLALSLLDGDLPLPAAVLKESALATTRAGCASSPRAPA